MRWPLMGLTVVFLLSCTTLAVLPRREPAPTLLVHNESIEVLRVYDEAGLLGTVWPGTLECIIIQRESTRELTFRQMSHTSRGPYFVPSPGTGWEVTIGLTPDIDVMSLKMTEPCQ